MKFPILCINCLESLKLFLGNEKKDGWKNNNTVDFEDRIYGHFIVICKHKYDKF